MQHEAQQILNLFTLKSNQELTDEFRLKAIERVLLAAYTDGVKNGKMAAIQKIQVLLNNEEQIVKEQYK